MHNFIMISVENNANEVIKLNLSPEEMQKKYGGKVEEEEPLY